MSVDGKEVPLLVGEGGLPVEIAIAKPPPVGELPRWDPTNYKYCCVPFADQIIVVVKMSTKLYVIWNFLGVLQAKITDHHDGVLPPLFSQMQLLFSIFMVFVQVPTFFKFWDHAAKKGAYYRFLDYGILMQYTPQPVWTSPVFVMLVILLAASAGWLYFGMYLLDTVGAMASIIAFDFLLEYKQTCLSAQDGLIPMSAVIRADDTEKRGARWVAELVVVSDVRVRKAIAGLRKVGAAGDDPFPRLAAQLLGPHSPEHDPALATLIRMHNNMFGFLLLFLLSPHLRWKYLIPMGCTLGFGWACFLYGLPIGL